MNIVSRAGWGAKPATGVTNLVPSRVTMCVLHHTTGTYSGSGQSVRNIQAFHMGPSRKWADIAYSFLVAPDGTIYEGRGWDKQGAHARGQNSVSIGIAFIGDGRLPIPDAARVSIAWLADEADRRFGTLRRVGHRDVGSTVCPGDALHGWWMSGAVLPAVTVPEAVEPEPVVSEPSRSPEGLSKPTPAENGEVFAQRISERPSPVPDLLDGWKAHMKRRGWLRKGR